MKFSLKLADIPTGALGREIPAIALSAATRRTICEAVAAGVAEMHHDVRVAVVSVDLNADVFMFTTPEDVETRQMCVKVSRRLFENLEQLFDPPETEIASAPVETAPCDSAPAAESIAPSEDAPPASDAASDPAPQPPTPVQADAVPSTEI